MVGGIFFSASELVKLSIVQSKLKNESTLSFCYLTFLPTSQITRQSCRTCLSSLMALRSFNPTGE